MKAYKTSKIEDYRIWNQPTLTSNGTMGESDFACYANTSYNSATIDCYQAFSPNTGTVLAYQSLKQSTLYVFFETKNPLVITKFSFYVPINGTQNNYNGGWAENIYLYGKNAQGNWEQIAYVAGGANMGNAHHIIDLSNNTKAYNSFKFQVSSKGTGHNDEVEISQIKIDGKEKIKTVKNVCKVKTEHKTVKIDPDKEPYYSIVGSPTISNGVVSGFSASNYLLTPNIFDVTSGQSWEMVFKVKTGSNVTTGQTISGHTGSTNYDPVVVTIQSGKFMTSLCSNSSSNIVKDKYGSYTVQANTTYYVKMTFDGSQYVLSYSLDGQTYTADITVSSTKTIWAYTLAIGRQQGDNSEYPWLGSIDMKESYIKINGRLWWEQPKTRQIKVCKMIGD